MQKRMKKHFVAMIKKHLWALKHVPILLILLLNYNACSFAAAAAVAAADTNHHRHNKTRKENALRNTKRIGSKRARSNASSKHIL